MKNLCSIVFLFISCQIFAQEQKEIIIKTNVSEATVFLNGAQILRKKAIELNAGKTSLKFVDLSGASYNKENGEVKWKFNLDPSAKKEIELKYSIKYPKNKTLFIE